MRARAVLIISGLFLLACQGSATDGPCVGAAVGAATVTQSGGSTSAVQITNGRDGSVTVVGTDGRRVVIGADGAVSSADIEVRITGADGTRSVYDVLQKTIVTEESYSSSRTVLSTSGSSAPAVEIAAQAASNLGSPPVVRVEDDGPTGEDDKDKGVICHVPPGNPANQHTLSVGSSAISAHLGHGDYLGACQADRVGVKTNGNSGSSGGKGKGKNK